ncbi:MAG: hypothetical protein ACXW3M_12020 [Rhodoplanes sp.]
MFGKIVDDGDSVPGSPVSEADGPCGGGDRSEGIDRFEQTNALVCDLDAVLTSKTNDGLQALQ